MKSEPIAPPECSVYDSWDNVYLTHFTDELPWVSNEVHPVLRSVVDSLPIRRGKALDLGCGLGQVGRYLAAKGFETTCLDISAAAIEKAKSLAGERSNIGFVRCNSLTWVAPEPFDLIVDFLHFHDIQSVDLKRYSSQIRHFIKPGGIVIVAYISRELGTPTYKRSSLFFKGEVVYHDAIDTLEVLGSEAEYMNRQKCIVGKVPYEYHAEILVVKHGVGHE